MEEDCHSLFEGITLTKDTEQIPCENLSQDDTLFFARIRNKGLLNMKHL